MSLTEVVVASCLLLGCLGGSLQLWAVALEHSLAEERRQTLRERVEAELMGSEARLRAQSRLLSPSANCLAQGQLLQAALTAVPVPEGLRRELQLQEEGPLLLLRVEAGESGEGRQRHWSPAAFGVCATPGAPATAAS